jgi:membrane-bound lytic murein transglycosylase D
MERILRSLLGAFCVVAISYASSASADGSSSAALSASAAGAVTPSDPVVLPSLLGSEPGVMSPSIIQNAPSITTVDLTAEDGSIWERIRKGFGMHDLSGPIVDDKVNWYTARPQALKSTIERSRKYLYHIVTELEKRGMPTELALLPLVESAFNPMAFSSAKAAGLWQFIPSTGKDFQLQQNWWVDQRRDIIASTNAALQYLQAIYEMHGDWQLALASYNWGEHAVARAMAANVAAGKPTDYASLNMPAETRQYVPKLQALKQIIAHPETYGVTLPEIPNKPYFVTIERREGMDVALAAKLAEMPMTEFLALNPSYNRPVIPGSHAAPLVLPVDNARKFEDNLSRHDEPLMSWKMYSLPKTETIEKLARRLNVSLETLRTANGLPSRGRLAAGYNLLIPQSVSTIAADMALNASEAKSDKESSSSRVRKSEKASGKTMVRTKATPRVAAPSKARHSK